MALLLWAAIGGGIYGLSAIALAESAKAAEPSTTPPRYKPMPSPMLPPPFSFLDASGRRGDLGVFAGKVVLLNLWATWCPPCVAEMPSLDRLQARLGGSSFQVVAISVDRGAMATVQPFFVRLNLGHLGIFLDPESKAQHTLGINGLPTSLLLDRDGRIVGALEGGADWDGPDAVRLIQGLIGGERPRHPAEQANRSSCSITAPSRSVGLTLVSG